MGRCTNASSTCVGACCTSHRGYFVRFRETPNESCYRFEVEGKTFLPSPEVSSMSFTRENSHHSPIADALLTALPMVEEVTLGYAFVTVRKVLSTDAAQGAKEFAAYFMKAHGESIKEEEAAMRAASEAGGGESSPSQPEVKSTVGGSDTTTAGGTAEASKRESAANTRTTSNVTTEPLSPSEDPPLEEEAIVSMIENTIWEDLRMHISALLTDYLYSGAPPLSLYAPPPHQDTLPQDGDSEVLLAIKELVRSAIRPLLQQDGGDIRLESFDPTTGEMRVGLLGACRRCHSRHHTLTDLIERTTRYWIPEVQRVVGVEEDVSRPASEAHGIEESEKTAVGARKDRLWHASSPQVNDDTGKERSTADEGDEKDQAQFGSIERRLGEIVDIEKSRACLGIAGNAQLVRHIKNQQ